MTNAQFENGFKKSKSPYDLEERTAKFGEELITFCREVKLSPINNPLVNQLIRSGTSIGANYCEADEASSIKDFINKLTIAKKEAKETNYWLRLIAHAVPDKKDLARKLWIEARELNLILAAIVRKSKINST